MALAASERYRIRAQIDKAAGKKKDSVTGIISGNERLGGGTRAGQKQCGGVGKKVVGIRSGEVMEKGVEAHHDKIRVSWKGCKAP